MWSLATVVAYEAALREELTNLRLTRRSTAFIIDIRSSGAQPKEVADALRSMVARLGPLHASRTAVVTASGIAKLQARRVADADAQVFTSMVLARDWATANADASPASPVVHDAPSDASAEGVAVHIHGPSDVDITLTPAAALETAKRIGDAAAEALSDRSSLSPQRSGQV